MNKSSLYKFTIIVPLYNEQDNLKRLEQTFNDFLPKSKLSPTCVLFVNDGSTDNSTKMLEDICSHNSDFFYINLTNNSGLSAALKVGIANTFSPYVGYIDADLQTTPEDFNILAEHIDKYQLSMGVRAARKDSFVKNLSSKIANNFRRAMTGDGVSDTGCPLKIMHTDYAKELPLFKGMHRFIPALIQMQGGAVCQTPVRHFPRQAGVSKYTLKNRLIAPLVDCFGFRWIRKRYSKTKIETQNIETA